jgi:hypothetical protein
MPARAPNVLNGAIELAFVFAAGALGYVKAPFWTAPALAAAMIVYWAFNRRIGLAQLRDMGRARLAGVLAVSLALITIALGGAYWLGGLASGRTT